MILLADPILAGLQDVARSVVFALFVLSALVLTVVVLIQEGKGGGLGSAFGGAAADAFGVKAGTVNRFTAYLAAAFLGLALLYAGLSSGADTLSIEPTAPALTIPGEEGDADTPPGETPGGSGEEGAPEGGTPGEGGDGDEESPPPDGS